VSSDGSITRLISGMKSGDDEAARRIWDRYSPRLAALAKERLPLWLHCLVSGDDVANSALCSVIMGLRDGRFPDLHDRNDLWGILACITVRKAINEAKRANRQKRRSSGECVPIDENIVDPGPSPDLARTAAEHFERLIDCLHKKDELLEMIALWKFEGYTSEEIARRLGCSSRRVARKLELIRMTWESETVQ
jgi:DNA-directed RNA polymerase specialized sigma24 family protein